MNARTSLLLTLLLALALPAAAQEAEAPERAVPSQLPTFSPEVIDTFSRLPVQEGGRVKPMSTFARYSLLPLLGRTRVTVGITPEGEVKTLLKGARGFEGEHHTYSASEWLLLCFLRPEFADRIPIFIVDDSDAIRRFGGELKRKRDVYSYNEIAPHNQKLVEETRAAMGIEERERDRVDTMVMGLGQNVLAYQRLTAFLQFARMGLRFGEGDIPDYFKADAGGRIRVSDFLEAIPAIRASGDESSAPYLQSATVMLQRYLGQTDQSAVSRAAGPAAEGRWDDVLGLIEPFAGLASAVQILPPADPAEGVMQDGKPLVNERWFTPSDAILTGLLFDDSRAWSIDRLRLLEDVALARDDSTALGQALAILADRTRADAGDRGEIDQLDREVSYLEKGYINKALVYFLVSFVLVAVTWAAPHARWSRVVVRIGVLAIVVGLTYLCVGVTHRYLIRGWAPVTNLYETIPFISACIVLLCLLIEWINRERIALSTAATLGAAGMFLAIRYEAADAQDTMPTLVAVLRSNFWLWTHVTIVTLGYACGLLGRESRRVIRAANQVLREIGGVAQWNRRRVCDDAQLFSSRRSWRRCSPSRPPSPKMFESTRCWRRIVSRTSTKMGTARTGSSW